MAIRRLSCIMKLHLPTDNGVTLIENVFIDQYMPGANGEFVKLYLYLLRCAGTGRELSISSIADFFDHTEKDVRRALAYWEKLSLLKLQYDNSDNITDIVFTGTASARETAMSGPSETSSGQDGAAITLPSTKTIPAARRRQLQQQEDIRQLVYVQERYLGRPLTSAESSNLLYFYDKLHFSSELIDYLIEYCASKGNPGSRYMEKVAQGWYLEGVTTVEQAKASSAVFQKDYRSIFRALGLGSRTPAPAETEYMDRWLGEYGFPAELITEACNRTIRQTHQASFDYTDGILKSWVEKKVTSLDDVRKLDQDFLQKKEESLPKTSSRSTRSSTAGSRKRTAGSSFSNMQQRDYDWSALEKQLLQAQGAAQSGPSPAAAKEEFD